MKRNRIHLGSSDQRSRHCAAILVAVSAVVLGGSLSGCTDSGGAPGPIDSVETVPPRTTAVPAPDDTTVDDVIEEAAPAPVTDAQLDDEVELDTGVRISVTDTAEITVEATTPGEVAGPAVAVTLRFENGSAEALDIGGAMVTLLDAAGNVAAPTTSSPAAPPLGTLQNGEAAEGTYVFLVPEDTRDEITLTVDYQAGAPVVVFHGAAT